MILSHFIIPLFVVCLLAPIGLRYLIKPIFPKRKFSKLLGWAMFLTIVVTILYCRWLQFSDSCWPIFVDGLLVAFGMFLVFTAYHDITLWMTEFVNIPFKEFVDGMRKSPPYLISIYVIVLPSIGFSWFFSSHGYYEIHIVPFILSVYGMVLGVMCVCYGFRRKLTSGFLRIVAMFFIISYWALIFRPVVWPYHCTPWAAHRARQNIGLIRPGMTAPQVWETLGLTSYRFPTRRSGSGSPYAWPINYQLWPGDCLYCRWNNTTNPPILVLGIMKNSIYDLTRW
jgi:hypothetical protein